MYLEYQHDLNDHVYVTVLPVEHSVHALLRLRRKQTLMGRQNWPLSQPRKYKGDPWITVIDNDRIRIRNNCGCKTLSQHYPGINSPYAIIHGLILRTNSIIGTQIKRCCNAHSCIIKHRRYLVVEMTELIGNIYKSSESIESMQSEIWHIDLIEHANIKNFKAQSRDATIYRICQ